jgi:hypothetical protein
MIHGQLSYTKFSTTLADVTYQSPQSRLISTPWHSLMDAL